MTSLKKAFRKIVVSAVLIGIGFMAGASITPANAGAGGGNAAATMVAFDQLRPVAQQVDLVRRSCNAGPRRLAQAHRIFDERRAKLDAALTTEGFNFASPEYWFVQDFYFAAQGLCPKVSPPGPVGRATK